MPLQLSEWLPFLGCVFDFRYTTPNVIALRLGIFLFSRTSLCKFSNGGQFMGLGIVIIPFSRENRGRGLASSH